MPKLLPLIAAALLVASVPAMAQPAPRDPGAAANVRQSQLYEQELSNPAFRAKRIREECGPITDPQLHEECVASFGPPTGARRPHR